jgi:hypothetical protein
MNLYKRSLITFCNPLILTKLKKQKNMQRFLVKQNENQNESNREQTPTQLCFFTLNA